MHLPLPLKRLTVGLLAVASVGFMSTPSWAMANFYAAKKALTPIYYQINKELGETSTIYCGCPIEYSSSSKWSVDLEPCGYKVRRQAARANRIEVEHVMPAWEFGHQLKCWQEGGRKNCGKDKTFARMEGDLHNLYPSVGEVNGDRGNFQFTDWGGKNSMYGKCTMLVDFKRKQAQPPVAARGRIARAYMYMAKTYDISLSRAQQRLYEAWDKMYPPQAEECLRNKLIEKKQGNDNPFITGKCK